MRHHLVILNKVYLQCILRGHKTTECRLSRTRRPPFGVVRTGDTLWLKQSGGPVVATAKARKVEFIHPLGAHGLTELRRRHAETTQADYMFFAIRAGARFATLIHLGRVRAIEPFAFPKSDRHAWVVLPGPPGRTCTAHQARIMGPHRSE